jgi:hypothetical protein
MQMNTKWWETAEPCEPVRLLGAQRRHGRTCWRLDPVANGRVGGDAVTLGCTYLLPPLSFGGASTAVGVPASSLERLHQVLR